MKDLDFDELDKAVSSLLGDSGAASKNESPSPDSTADAPTSSSVAKADDKTVSKVAVVDGNKPKDDQPSAKVIKSDISKPKAKVASKSTTKSSAKADALQNLVIKRPMLGDASPRQTGKFIDVVQPAKPKDAPVPSHGGVVIKPINSNVVPEEKSSEPVAEAKVESSQNDEQKPTELEHETTHRTDWPDPLDHHDFKFKDELGENKLDQQTSSASELKITDKTKVVNEVEAMPDTSTTSEAKTDEKTVLEDKDVSEEKAQADEVDTTDEPARASEDEAEKPASSPFLPEAKVEKRPLGAFSDFAPKDKPKTDDLAPNTTAEETPIDKPKEEPSTSQPLPPELNSDILAVEAGGPVTDLDGAAVPEEPKKESVTSEPPVDTKESSPNPALASIPQQYQSLPPQTDTTSRPIFDTKEYHPPLHPEAHKRSRLVTVINVVLIIILIVALAVGGYFAYMYF